MNRHSTTKVSTYPSITITSPTLKSKKQIFLSTFISKHLPRLMISKTQKQMKVERFNSCNTHTRSYVEDISISGFRPLKAP